MCFLHKFACFGIFFLGFTLSKIHGENWFYNAELPSSGLSFSTGLFVVEVSLGYNGELEVDPGWIKAPGVLPFDQMAFPPRVRIAHTGDWIWGEFALVDGQWMSLFFVPFTESEDELTNMETVREFTSTDHQETYANGVMLTVGKKQTPSNASTLEAADGLEKNHISQDLNSSARLVVHVDASKGDDQFDGRAKLKDVLGTSGPKKTFQAAADLVRQSGVKEVEVVLESGIYEWSDFGVKVEEIILTPVGDVILNMPKDSDSLEVEEAT